MSLNIRSDTINRLYKREVDNILDLLGDMGGFLQIVQAIGIIFTFALVNRSMNSAMIKEVYQV